MMSHPHYLFLSLFLVTFSITPTQGLSSPSSTSKCAVVVGGGPVGLATALTLSNPPHCYNVTVLEQASVEQYDPTKAYLYNVNPRGQVWMKELFPSALEKLQQRGSVGSMANITIVPADPQQPIPQRKTLAIAKEERVQGPQLDTRSFWIPRHSMIGLLEDEIQEQETKRQAQKDTTTTNYIGSITLKKGRKFDNLEPLSDDENTLRVTCQDTETGTMEEYCATLIVAADGFRSPVRDCLADTTKITWLQSKPKQFQVKQWISPASGLRMKVLQMPPGFEIPDADGTRKPTENEYTYAIRSINKGFTNYVGIGLLPVKDSSMIRPANIITRPNHEVWNLKDGPSTKAWFTKAFPRLNWDDYVDDAEWERFAQAQGTAFPNCQYSAGLQVNNGNNSGVVLVGDSAHAFPPDIGQGINAGLLDVVALDRALRGKNVITGQDQEKPKTLAAALTEYERQQGPQIKALIRISRFGFPYQYRQALLRDRIGRLLLTTNIAFRMLLNKLSFGFIPTSSIVLLQNANLTYKQVMQRADLTTAGLSLVFLALAWKLLGASIKTAIGMA